MGFKFDNNEGAGTSDIPYDTRKLTNYFRMVAVKVVPYTVRRAPRGFVLSNKIQKLAAGISWGYPAVDPDIR